MVEIERRGAVIERVVRGQERARGTAAGPLLLLLITLALVAGGSAPAAPATELPAEPAGGSAGGDGAALLIRWIPTADLGIARPAGLAYVPRTKSLVVVGPAARRTKLLRLSVFEDVQGRSRVRTVARPSTVAFDPVKGRLAFLTRRALLPVAGTPKLRRTAARRASLAGLGLVSPRAMTFDRATKTWHILDAGARAIVRVSLRGGALRPAGRTPLGALGRAGLRGIAFNPTDGLVYVLSPNRGVLFGLDRAGTVQSAYTLGDLGLRNPTAIVIAPSADPTDDPSAHHLYVSDAGSSSQRGGIVEARLEESRRLAAAAASVEEVEPTVVQIIQTSLFSPSSPDPAGIAYNPATDRLLISDSEVNETPTYQGFNLFTATRNGTGTGTGTTLAFSKEPTGLGYNPGNGTLYVGDDDADAVSVVRPGPDGRHGTSDDEWYKFSTGALGSTDTEGVEYDTASGHLYVCDGIALDIFNINPVNGVFGDGDDVVIRLDIGQYGARDCEGMGIDPARDTLLALDPSSKKLYELTKAGALVRVINGGGIPTTNKALAGVTVAPTSDPNDHPSKTNYWIVDRQVDNGADPNENDGLLYELSVPTTSTEPAISVISPAEGALVAGTVVIEAASIGGVSFSRVDFHVDGVLVGTDTNGGDGWTTSWPTSGVSNGAHVVRATGTAVGGATAQDSHTVTVDNAPPTVAVTAPTAGSTVESTISVTAAASDNTTVASVEFFVDGASIGTDTSSAGGWSVAWNTTAVANGSHTITAVARDVAGNTATSAAVGVLVGNPPIVTVAVPVSTGNDDADELESGTVRRSNGDLELGSDGGIPTTVGLRFAGVNVPKGVRIEEAYVQFQADEAGRDVASLTIRGQTADNAASFTTAAFNISSRPRTNASVAWAPPQWLVVPEAGPGQRTPNLSAVLQEIVDRPGWAPGNALVVLFNGTGRRTPESYEGLAPPILHVAYSAVGTEPPPDEPPQVAISSPSAGALVSGAVTLTATASDDLGVSSVQFAVDGAPVGTDTNGADGWSMTWNATAAGERVITATAMDTGGQTTTSAPVSVIVDSPPSVALGSPAAGATVSGTVTVTASAADDDAVTAVSFSVGGTTIGTDTNGSDGWSVPWNTTQVPDGPHALAATATDTRGQTASDSRSVTVDNFDAPPTVSFTTPPPGALLAGTVLVAVAASDDRGIAAVEFSSGGTLIGTDTDGSDGWSISWDTTGFADGPRTLTATARDTVGQTALTATNVTIDNAAPSVAVTAPSAGATVAGTVSVAASASDSTSVASVEFLVDGASIGADANGSNGWSVSWNSKDVANGSHTVTAIARDAAGNEATSPGVTVTVDNPSLVTLAVPISVGIDDADQLLDTGAIRRTNGDLELGSDGGIPTIVGLRFAGLGIPSGAVVEEAYVQFTVDENGKTDSSLSVQAESADNAASFTTAAFNISSRLRTAASVAWSPPRWIGAGKAGPEQQTPDLSAVLQEVVDRPGWSAGNALVVLFTGSGRRTPESFEGLAPPVLHVSFTVPGS